MTSKPDIDTARSPVLTARKSGRPTASRWAERIADCAVGLFAAALEAVAFLALAQWGWLSIATGLATHLAVAGLLWLWLGYRARGAADVAMPQLILLVTAATGPIGGALTALSALMPLRDAAERPLLDRWYDRIAHASDTDLATELADGFSIGRTMDLDRPVTTSFEAVMRGADTRSQQAVLGLVARAFKPEYVPALGLALRSGEPLIRVQAAAVATRIRPELAAVVSKARALLERPDSGGFVARLTARRHLGLAIGSGLLDLADKTEATDLASSLDRLIGDPALALCLGEDPTRAARMVLGLPPSARIEVEERLLVTGRFRDLRRTRKLVRLLAGHSYRVRAMPRPTIPPGQGAQVQAAS